MSDLTVQSQKTDSASDLTAYNVDGLELFFTKNRKAYAHTTAISRMAEMSQGALNNFIINGLTKIEKEGVICVKMKRGAAYTKINLYPSKVIVACLRKYNPARLEQFLGFGIDEGLAQMFGVPLPQATATKSTSDLLQIAAQAALDMSYIRKHCETNPGFERELDAILDRHGKVLSGSMAIREMAELRGRTLTMGQSQAIGRLMADSYKTRKELPEAPKRKVAYKQPNGNWQTVWVGSYPIEMLSVFDSACSAFGVLSLSDSE